MALTSTSVTLDLRTEVVAAGELAFCLAVAAHLDAEESLTVSGPDGDTLAVREVALGHGTRLHLVDAPLGDLRVEYAATVSAGSRPAPVTDADRFTYVLPSRYCPSDRVAGWAAGEFGGVDDPWQLALRVVEWVGARTEYTPGSTDAGDDALVPLHTGQGVCRDYAHLTTTLLRALEVPARYVSVYAPGLDPMDAHAVVEVAVGDEWRLLDATRLAPRASMVRTGTGRDAADVALMTTLGAETGPFALGVTAVADPDLPQEDPSAVVVLA
ncbi:transglutaminase-like domain-containing protein [Phycicoccus sonneratiae]|uniref:Transglutaminase family protein n=1 Tax=Phycicoccus sonneratiae TaxID=2807628 RepID=A0ABS2CR71_9MICO|nr:transglutaminase family protein [Phycicoccus sonneraticus]MBM6402330.1 transglutaminase family protein [Phycicoccus sonneraticus]